MNIFLDFLATRIIHYANIYFLMSLNHVLKKKKKKKQLGNNESPFSIVLLVLLKFHHVPLFLKFDTLSI